MTDPTPREPDSARSAWGHGSPDGSADAASTDAHAGAEAPAGPDAQAAPTEHAVPAAEARIAEELTDGDWHRLHPATPLLRGGIVFLVVIGFLLSSLREQLVEQFVPGQRRDGEQDLIPMLVETGSLIWVILGLLAFTLLAVGVSYLSWRMHTFRVTEETVEVRSGILSRTNRRARLDRIQGVNIVRPVVARLIGAAKLEIQVAGNDANLPLQYLRSRDADAFRLRVLRLASGARAEAAGSRPAAASAPAGAARGFVGARVDDFLAPELDPDSAPPQSVVRIPIPRLVGAVLLSAPTVVLVLFVVVGIPLIVRFEAWYLLVPLLPTLLGSAGFFVRRITRSLRYSVAGTPDGVRVGFGLLSTSNDTIPPGRIHAVEVVQPLLWRAAGWWEIRITRASHSSAPGAAGQQNTSILPVGDRRDVDRVLGLVLPDLVGEQALALVDVGMTGRGGADDGFTTSPRRARILKPFSWRRTGFAVDASAFLVRRGVIWRRLVIVPHARTQGVDLTQGPIDRRLDLVSVRAATVAGPVDTRLGAIDRATGMELSTRLVAAAVASARSDTSAHWGAGAGDWPAPGSEPVAPAAPAAPATDQRPGVEPAASAPSAAADAAASASSDAADAADAAWAPPLDPAATPEAASDTAPASASAATPEAASDDAPASA
ncbi:PH domain-containing protein, partial [Clavibacter michiganensis]|uniref:PH domain-containing protein n=1 Tax=Clavibacter michiganensis TaxID=28447 RepID=UPI00215791A1